MNGRGGRRSPLGLLGMLGAVGVIGAPSPLERQRAQLDAMGKSVGGKRIAAIVVPPLRDESALDFILEDGFAIRCFGSVGVVEGAYDVKPTAPAAAPSLKEPRRIYVASSWRSLLQPAIVHALRRCGHDVYDFRNPAGFSWSEIDPNWQNWTAEEYRQALQHPLAVKGYANDIAALQACEVCVLVLPSGRSASWEFGYAMGQGKAGVVVQLDDKIEPELMYREAQIVTCMNDLFDLFGEPIELADGGAE